MITPGAEPPRCAPADPAIEDQRHLAGPTDVQVLSDDLLEEDAPGHRPIQHLRQRELGLQDRHAVAVAGAAITPIERMGQPRQPLAQQPVDLLVVQSIADALQRLGVGAGQHPVVQRLELDATLAQLALGVLVAVDAQLGVVGEVRAELQEERAEVLVDAVEVVVVDHRRTIHDPRVGHAGGGAAATFGAHDAGLLLRAPDVQHAFIGVELLQVLLRHIVLALALGKAHHLHALIGHIALDVGHERIGLRCHPGGRSEALTQVAAQVPHDTTDALQLRHVHVQVHPVDALALEHDVVAQDFADAVW